MCRRVRAAASALVVAGLMGGAGCALELVPQTAAPASSPRHAGGDTWASEPSSRWTISITPDTGEDEAATQPITSAAAIPPAVPVRSEALAPQAAATGAQPEIHVASDAAGDDTADGVGSDEDVSRVTLAEHAAPPPEAPSVQPSPPAPRADALPTYVSSRSVTPGAAPVSIEPDQADAPAPLAETASSPRVAAVQPTRAAAAPQMPYVIEPPRRGGGEPGDAASDDLLDPEYRIGVEDLLDVSLLGEAELQHVTMRVSPRGTVDFPYAGTLTAAGLSVDEFRSALLEKLDDYYVSPQVTVFLREYRSRMVHILGEVPRPGPFKLTHRNTVMEVLSRAGGFTPLANKSDVQIIRSDAAGKRIIHVDVNEIIDDGRIDLDIPLESGDVINVPERLF